MNTIDKVIDFFTELIDNDTLIIIGVITIAILSAEHRELAIGGLLGFMGLKGKNAITRR